MDGIQPLLLSGSEASAGATNEDIDLGPVPEGLVWVLDHVAAEDETTAFTSLRIGVVRGLTFFPLEEELSPAAATLYTVPDPIRLVEGEFLRARFTGTTSADKLALYANGYKVQVR